MRTMTQGRSAILFLLAVVFAVAVLALGDVTGVIAGIAFGTGAVALGVVEVIAWARNRRPKG